MCRYILIISGILWEQVDPEHGYLGTVVIVDPKDLVGFVSHEKDWFALIRVRPGQNFTYYAGAGWDGNPRFRNESDWSKYVRREANNLF